MPLNERLIEVTTKRLIACRECHVIADVSINGFGVRLLCPRCHETLGMWATADHAVDEITAVVTNGIRPITKAHRRGSVTNSEQL
jgi:uncharacterized paraquat-inducible protein A